MSNRPNFTLGIEEEFQRIDPVTRDLRSHIQQQIIAKGKSRLQERVKPEMHGSVVEVGTGICRTVKQAKEEVCGLQRRGRIRSPTGMIRRFSRTTVTASLSKTCNRSQGRIGYSDCTSMSGLRTAKPRFS